MGTRVGIAVMIVAAFAAFLPAIRAPFVFDDVGSIPGNPTIEHVFPLSTSLNPPPRIAVSGRPVVNLSLAVDHAMSASLGLDAESETVVYRVTNVLLHVLCGLLLFGVIRRTMSLARLGAWANSSADTVALISTGIWLVHPIQSEAVDYVIQRTELLVSACYLATLYASIRAWDAPTGRRRTAWMVGGVAACAVGMASKEVMATAPFVVALYDRAFRVSSWRELANDRARRWFYGGLFATLALLAALIAGGGRADSVGFGLGLPWYSYLYSQGWAIAHYLQLLVWPTDLRLDYGSAPVRGIGGLVGGLIVSGGRRRDYRRRDQTEAMVAGISRHLVFRDHRAVVEHRSHPDGDRGRAAGLSRVRGRHRWSRRRGGVRVALASPDLHRRFRGRRGAASRRDRTSQHTLRESGGVVARRSRQTA